VDLIGSTPVPGTGESIPLYAAPLGIPWLTILTSMFMHGGWLHLGGNMLYLWIFGDNIEDRFGHLKFTLFYFLCGIAATFSQMAFNSGSQVPNVGASGAIAGVLGAYRSSTRRPSSTET